MLASLVPAISLLRQPCSVILPSHAGVAETSSVRETHTGSDRGPVGCNRQDASPDVRITVKTEPTGSVREPTLTSGVPEAV